MASMIASADNSAPASNSTNRFVLHLLFCMICVISLTRLMLLARTFGDNDNSRILTMRAIAENGTFQIGERLEFADGTFLDTGLLFEKGQRLSIDVVLNPKPFWTNPSPVPGEPHARKAYYSSKPPMLPLLMAVEYYCLRHLLAWDWTTHRAWILRALLMTWNVMPWLLVLWFSLSILECQTQDLWVQVFWLGLASFGTMIFSFETTINNHVVAAWSTGFALVLFLRKVTLHVRDWFAIGLLAGFTMANELPAASMVLLLMAYAFYRYGWLAASVLILGVIPFLAVEEGLIWLSLGDWQPAYAKFGTVWYNFPGSYWENPQEIDALQQPWFVYCFHLTLGHHGWFSLTPAFLLACLSWQNQRSEYQRLQVVSGMSWLLFAVVLGFYVLKTNNYGGWTCGPRWLMWLIPFFLWCSLSGIKQLRHTVQGRSFAMAALSISIFSAWYPGINPWQHPWLFQWARFVGWIDY